MITMPLVHSGQTVHLSCAEINTISKWTETSFHLTDVTLEFHWVCPKWFSCSWYIRCTPCTYLAMRLTLSKQTEMIFTWFTPPRSTIWCAQKWFQSLWYIWHKPCTHLASRLIRSQNGLKPASTWPTSPRSTIMSAWKDFRARGTFGANRAPILCWD
jgi:hypothetical protein